MMTLNTGIPIIVAFACLWMSCTGNKRAPIVSKCPTNKTLQDGKCVDATKTPSPSEELATPDSRDEYRRPADMDTDGETDSPRENSPPVPRSTTPVPSPDENDEESPSDFNTTDRELETNRSRPDTYQPETIEIASGENALSSSNYWQGYADNYENDGLDGYDSHDDYAGAGGQASTQERAGSATDRLEDYANHGPDSEGISTPEYGNQIPTSSTPRADNTNGTNLGKVHLRLARADGKDKLSPFIAQIRFERTEGITDVKYSYRALAKEEVAKMLIDRQKSYIQPIEIPVMVTFAKHGRLCVIDRVLLKSIHLLQSTPLEVTPTCN